MAFSVKDWQDSPSTSTPISAAALEDLETRLSAYSDSVVAGITANSGIDAANVKSSPYNAVGSGAVDDDAAIQAAIDAVNAAGGGIVFIPHGTYRLAAQLNLKTNVWLMGAGMDVTTLTAKAGFVNSLVRGNSVTNNRIQNMTIDGNNEAGITNGLVYYTGNGTKKNFVLNAVRLRRCNTTRGLNIWTAERIWITDSRIEDCIEGLYVDTPTNEVLVSGNEVNGGSVAQMGIVIRAGSSQEAGVRVIGNAVNSITQDPSGIGTAGYGINIVNCRNTIVANNTLDTINEGGIHIGSGSAGSTVVGNSVRAAAQGIYVESNFGDTTVGSGGSPRGAIVSGNEASFCTSYGISVSYGPGSQVTGNICHDNDADGIVTDSDRVTISSNTCYNNYKVAGAPAQCQKAGIRLYANTDCIVTGNQCFDNQTVKTQSYGIAAGDGRHVIKENSLRGNATGSLFQASTSTGTTAGHGNTNVCRANVVDDAMPTVASASTITVPSHMEGKAEVTGTTGITAITIKPAGEEITLYFQGSVTVTHTGTKAANTIWLAGAANFSATAEDQLTLVSNGTYWREKARSVN